MKRIDFILLGAILLFILLLVSHFGKSQRGFKGDEIKRIQVPTKEERALRRKIHEKLMSVLPQDKFEIKIRKVTKDERE